MATDKVMRILKKNIADQNDLFRTTMISSPLHKIVMTAGLVEDPNLEKVVTAVREFKSFTEDNDPHGEHDCALFDVENTKYMFKIDYFDPTFHVGADPYGGKVARLLTILRADEY
jgi:Protein of unknown function (DUF3768)